MNRRPSLTYQGSAVGLCRRTAWGKAIVAYLDRQGRPTCHCVEVWPHQLRGIGWHLAEIKARIAQLPLGGTATLSDGLAASPASFDTAAPRPLLFVHHAAPKD